MPPFRLPVSRFWLPVCLAWVQSISSHCNTPLDGHVCLHAGVLLVTRAYRSPTTDNWNLILAEPFQDSAFVSRLQKLVSMLGSEQPAEAEAARRKLMEHLGAHRLSLTDVAMRLRDGAAPAQGGGASFTQGTREGSLERQLSIARSAKLELESELRRAQMQVLELQKALQQAAFDVGRALRGQGQARLLAAAGWTAAAVATLMVLLMAAQLPVAGLLHPRSAQHTVQILRPVESEPADSVMRLSPGEHYGIVTVQDLPVRLNPDEVAGVRAFLNRGMRVVIEQQARVGPTTWLQIRSVTGSGWVPSAAVLH
jgi:hypothetical protein